MLKNKKNSKEITNSSEEENLTLENKEAEDKH